jgi:hypothetical protein
MKPMHTVKGGYSGHIPREFCCLRTSRHARPSRTSGRERKGDGRPRSPRTVPAADMMPTVRLSQDRARLSVARTPRRKVLPSASLANR